MKGYVGEHLSFNFWSTRIKFVNTSRGRGKEEKCVLKKKIHFFVFSTHQKNKEEEEKLKQQYEI